VVEKKEKEEKEEVKDIFLEKEKKLPIIVKADAKGTLEAVLENLPVDVQVIYSGVGEIAESDVFLAQSGKAKVIGFRVKPSPSAKKLALDQGVEIKEYQIIYELLEDIERLVLTMLSPDIEREIAGQAEIIAEFEIDKKRVAGSRVSQGEINRQLPISVKRGEEIIGEVKITSMKHLKEDIQVAKKGQEFGASFAPSIDFELGDAIISYKQ